MMDTQKINSWTRAILAFAAIAALSFPCVARAVSIGEIVMQSKLGEPLLAQVGLTLAKGEHIEDTCLSLVLPDPEDEDASGYLTKANLSVKTDGNRQYIAISSRNMFNDAFARLRLQIKCSNLGRVVKTLTILPDLDAAAPQAQIAAPNVVAEAETRAEPLAPKAHETVRAAKPRDRREMQPDPAKYAAEKTARPVHKRHRQPASASMVAKKQNHEGTFRLKLSADTIDESRIGKISPEERSLLLARQKLLDADDQTANFLAMQHQVKQLQDELGQIRSQLSKLGVNPNLTVASSTPPATSVSATSAVPTVTSAAPTVSSSSVQINHPKPTVAVKSPVPQQDNSDQIRLIIAIVLILVILALGLGLRHYSKIKSRIGSRSHQFDELLPNESNIANTLPAAPKMGIPPARKLPTQAQPSLAKSNAAVAVHTQPAVAKPKTGEIPKTVVPTAPPPSPEN
jgi:hypothetical protein